MNMKEERESGTERQERQVKEEGWETGGGGERDRLVARKKNEESVRR